MKSADQWCISASEFAAMAEKAPFEKLSSIVLKLIEEAIITRRLAPKTKINVVRIAELLNISRTPVKEALNALMKTGLVIVPPGGSGYYVFDASGAFMDQFFGARRAIEAGAAYLCAKKSGRLDYKTLKSLAEAFGRAYENADFKTFTSADKDFHHLLVHSCGNPMLIHMYEELDKNLCYFWARSQEYLQHMSSNPFNDLEVISNQHLSIIKALRLGIPDIAETAMKAHLDSVYTALYAIAPPQYS